MYNISAYIPKTKGDHNIAADLFHLGGRSIVIEKERNAFYNEFHFYCSNNDHIAQIVNEINDMGGVVSVGGIYYQNYSQANHLEIADQDGMLNVSDGVYIDEQ